MSSIHGETVARFTYDYLRLMLREHCLTYTKRNVRDVSNRSYFNKLIERFQNDNHLNSFGVFYISLSQICQEEN